MTSDHLFQRFYTKVLSAPKWVVAAAVVITLFFASQLELRWETDARVYMPKGHPAIIYDEKVEHLFGAKDAIVIAIVNEKEGIFNATTLARIARVTEKVAALEGVVANRSIDVASLATASFFLGTETTMGAKRLMPTVPTTAADIEHLKQEVYSNSDIFVGNIISADGKAAMIRAKLKEGAANRYQTYWQIKAIIGAEEGGSGGSGWQGNAWSGSKEPWAGNEWNKGTPTAPGKDANSAEKNGSAKSGDAATAITYNDKFYLAGRPVIEVTSGQQAITDLQVMLPLLLLVIGVTLFAVFKTMRGVLLPMGVMVMAVIWTMGLMSVLGVPLYTISTMLPVILIVVGVGNGIHVMSHYYDHVLEDPQGDSKTIVAKAMDELGAPLFMTTATTAVGFLSLLFAEMPPFKVFGLFTVIGILFCWLLSVTLLPAVLVLMRPKVGGYLKKRQSLRVHNEQSGLAKNLVTLVEQAIAHKKSIIIGGALCAVVALLGISRLYVDSSWMSDFSRESEIVKATDLINDKFSGTITLNIIVDGKKPGALKSPALLQAMEALQNHVEKLPYVGDSLSVVDYLKSMNKNLHAGDEQFNVLPATQEQIAEYLFLFSISGRPEELDEVADFNYQQANISVRIKSDHTLQLKNIIDHVNTFVATRFKGLDADVNLAGSGNNSYVWADLLISSQTMSILLSKIGIFLIGFFFFRSYLTAFFVVVPISLSTLFIGGFAGLMGISLDVSTVLAAGVAIGVGVDYAIHYIFRYQREIEAGKEHLEATRAVARGVGKTIVFNAIVVTAGFAVLLFSQFPQHAKLGQFVTAYMVVSCLIALVILPVMYSLVKLRRPQLSDSSDY